MSVTEQSPIIQYQSGTSALTFSIPYPFVNPSDIRAIITSQTGMTTELSYGQDYSVTGAGSITDSGYYTSGTATLVNYIPAQSILTLRRDGAYEQLSEYPENTLLNPKQIEKDFDQQELQIQQIAEIAGRCIQVPDGANINPADYLNTLWEAVQEAQDDLEEAGNKLQTTQDMINGFSSNIDEGVAEVQQATQEALDAVAEATDEAQEWANIAQGYAEDNRDYIQTHSIWTTDNAGDIMPVNNTIITEDPDWELDSAGDIMPKEGE